MDRDRRLITRLADGRFHSGESLARVLGVSRTAIWKHVQSIATRFDLEIHAVRGRGYRLPYPIELLDAAEIECHVPPASRRDIVSIEVLDSVPSTNRYLAERLDLMGNEARVCIAEQQTEGRGRRGRSWISPFGANLYFSLHWQFDLPMANLNGLSLVAGVAVVQALERLGVEGMALKWPNDLHVGERKLGGILVEVFGQTAGPVSAVIGIGLNFDMPAASGQAIDQQWTDLKRIAPDLDGGRNRLAGLLIDELVQAVTRFTRAGWPAFQEAWRQRDGYLGRAVEIHTSGGMAHGTYLGVDDDGGLVLQQDGGRRVFHAGEVSLRATTVHGEGA